MISDNELLPLDFNLTRKYLLSFFSLYVDQSSLFHLRTYSSSTKICLSLIHVRLKKYSRKSLSSWRFSISSILTHSKKYVIELCFFFKKWLIFFIIHRIMILRFVYMTDHFVMIEYIMRTLKIIIQIKLVSVINYEVTNHMKDTYINK